jgi:hypothetical protein
MDNVDKILDKYDKEKWDEKTTEEPKTATSYSHACDENGEYIMKMPKPETERLTLTGVYLVTNKDGVHTEKELIGYIDQHPFVVLHQLLSKYYVSGYWDNDLYPIFMAGYKHSLFIKNEGDSYSYANIGKIKIKDIHVFCSRYTKVELAKVDNKYSEEYLNLLSMATNSNPDLQQAIDLQDYQIDWFTIANKSDIDLEDNNKLLIQTYLMIEEMDKIIHV